VFIGLWYTDNHMSNPRWLFVCVVFFVGLTAITAPVTGQTVSSDQLKDALNSTDAERGTPQIDAPDGITATSTDVTVAITARESAVSDAIAAIEDHGTVDHHHGSQIQATVSRAAVDTLADHDAIASIREPRRASRQANPDDTTTDAVRSLGGDDLHDANITGNGATVVVIDSGFDTTHPSIADNVIDSKDFTGEGINAGDTDHGTAVAEVVHDTAPDADLVLISIDTVLEFQTAAEWIADREDIDVVVASLGFYGMPLDGDGGLTAPVVDDEDTLWVASAGNQAAGGHWHDSQRVPNQNDVVTFGDDESGCNFVRTANEFSVYAQWDDWDSSTADDYDLSIFQYNLATGELTLLDQSINDQTAGAPPYEAIRMPASGFETTYCIAINNYDASGTHTFDLWIDGARLDEATAARSVAPPSTSPDILAVGAVNYTTSEVTPYSSRGPTIDGRQGVDIVAPTGVESSIYDNPFYGTSSAAPHVAGGAALITGQYATIEPQRIQSKLQNADQTTQFNRGELPNTVAGAGVLNLSAAVEVRDVSVEVIQFAPLDESAGRYELAVYVDDLSPDGASDVVTITLPESVELQSVTEVSGYTIPVEETSIDTQDNEITAQLNPKEPPETGTQMTVEMVLSG
jgi:subtilisin family serine protease